MVGVSTEDLDREAIQWVTEVAQNHEMILTRAARLLCRALKSNHL